MGKTSLRTDASTRAERKFEKKVQFYDKVRDTVVKKTIQKKNKRSRRKNLKAYDLSALSDFLPDVNLKAPKLPPEFKLTCKSRQNLVLKESNQLKTVLNHPTFQSDPLAAIHQHLQNTQPVEDKPKRKNTKTGKKTKKKKKPKASPGSQLMEA